MKFFKLLKYEFLENIASVALINTVLFALLIIIKVYIDSDFNWIIAIIISIIPIALFVSIVFLVTIVIRTLYLGLFSQEGYLTLSLPVSIDAILISKILISALWILISIFVVLLWLIFIAFAINDASYVIQQFLLLISNYSFLEIIRILLLGIVLLIKPITLLLLVLSILHIGKIVRFRKLIGILLFMIILFIETIAVNVLYLYIDSNMIDYMVFVRSLVDSISYYINFFANLFVILIYYFVSRYLIKNKLEI